ECVLGDVEGARHVLGAGAGALAQRGDQRQHPPGLVDGVHGPDRFSCHVVSAPPQPLATARSRSTTSARSSAGSRTTTSGPNSTSQASRPCPYGISNSSQPSPRSRTAVAFARRGSPAPERSRIRAERSAISPAQLATVSRTVTTSGTGAVKRPVRERTLPVIL